MSQSYSNRTEHHRKLKGQGKQGKEKEWTKRTVRGAKPLSGVQKLSFGVCSRRSSGARWCDRGCSSVKTQVLKSCFRQLSTWLSTIYYCAYCERLSNEHALVRVGISMRRHGMTVTRSDLHDSTRLDVSPKCISVYNVLGQGQPFTHKVPESVRIIASW